MKRSIAFVTAITTLCLLVSCSDKKEKSERVMDLCEVYGDFFDYTFNDNYTIDVINEGAWNEGEDDEQAYRLYNISYTHENGMKRDIEIYSREFTEDEKKYYASEQDMMNDNVNASFISEIPKFCKKEVIENILSKHIDIEYVENESIYKTDEYNFYVSLYSPISVSTPKDEYYEKSCTLVNNHLTPETGYKLSEADLKTFADDKEYIFIFSLTISPTADAELYIDKMNAIVEDYFAYTENPMNCQFVVKQSELNEETENISSNQLFLKTFLMGEEIDINKKKEEDEKYRLNNEIIRICIEEE